MSITDRSNILKREAILPWLVCFTAALFFFYEFIQMNMFNAIDTQLMRDFSLKAEALGKLSAMYFYANIFFLFFAGSILDRFSTQKVILLTLAICAGGTFGFSLSNSIVMAATARLLTGIGSAFCFLSCIRLASRWFPTQRLALVTGFIVTMAMIGGMVAQTPLTMLANAFGWRIALRMDAALGIAIMVLIWMFVRDYPDNYSQLYNKEREQLHVIGYLKSWRLSFLRLQNWLCGVYTSLMNLPIGLLGGVWGVPYLLFVHHLTNTQASYVTSMLFLGTIIGAPVMGWISDRITHRKLPMMIGAVFSLAVVWIILHSAAPSLSWLMTSFFTLGFITSTQILSYPMVTESNPSMLTATSVSVVSICAMSGYGIFQPVFGHLMDIRWSGTVVNGAPFYTSYEFSLAMLLFPLGCVIALLVTLFMRETYVKKNGVKK